MDPQNMSSANEAIISAALSGAQFGDLGPPNTPEDKEFYRKMLLFGYGLMAFTTALTAIWLVSADRQVQLHDPAMELNARQLTGSLTMISFFFAILATPFMTNASRWPMRILLIILLPSSIFGLVFVEAKLPIPWLRNALYTVSSFSYAAMCVYVCRHVKQPE